MIKNNKNLYLLFYFILSLLFMELILKLTTTNTSFFSLGLTISFIFAIFLGVLYFFISSFFLEKTSHILSTILLGLTGFIFASQFIYYKFFKTFYSIYSAGNAGQVFEFWNDILKLAIKQSLFILLFFLPAILLLVIGRKFLTFHKINRLGRGILLGVLIFVHIIGLTTIYTSGKDQYSAYDLYFDSSYPILSVERLGLITTMRLDLQRLVSGWAPTLKASPVYVSVDESKPPTDHLKNRLKDNATEKLEAIFEEGIENKKVEYQIMDINFEQLITDEPNETIKELHTYFQSVPPTTKNDYTGKYEGYNLILITAESFSPYAIHKEVTPTLYKMLYEGYNFTNFYTPLWGVSTSDGEYVALTSLIPKTGVWSFQKSGKNNMPLVMGNQLKKIGYKTVAYHNHYYSYYGRDVSHPNMGYDYKGLGNGLNVTEIWPESDYEMMEVTVPEFIDNQPFHAYYMTVSGHMQYSYDGNNMARRNKEAVKDLPYSEQAKAYIATQVELDKALEHLLAKLEEEDIADKTLIAISADHYPYGLDKETIDELAGHEVESNFELYKNTFILYTKDMEPITIDKPSSSLDIIPTLSNLLGLEYDSRLVMGRDIFSDTDPLVIFWNKSFITDKGKYNSVTEEFISLDEDAVNEKYISTISAIIDSKFYFSAKILDTDYYSKVFKDTKILRSNQQEPPDR